MDIFKKAIFKTKNGKGFTLAELLIVVAIIAVLVAVSIPIFSGKLEKSREATDVANMRAAKAAAVTQYLSTGGVGGQYYYDADNGKLVSAKTAISYAYGQGTEKNGGTTYTGYKPKESQVGKILSVFISRDANADDEGGLSDGGDVDVTWVAK